MIKLAYLIVDRPTEALEIALLLLARELLPLQHSNNSAFLDIYGNPSTIK
ncbi:hypothetical protein OAQ84_00170 [Bdellovibrionales bacterium]|nr:hypothetical protein [Bdellovibrionales bacterium]